MAPLLSASTSRVSVGRLPSLADRGWLERVRDSRFHSLDLRLRLHVEVFFFFFFFVTGMQPMVASHSECIQKAGSRSFGEIGAHYGGAAKCLIPVFLYKIHIDRDNGGPFHSFIASGFSVALFLSHLEVCICCWNSNQSYWHASLTAHAIYSCTRDTLAYIGTA